VRSTVFSKHNRSIARYADEPGCYAFADSCQRPRLYVEGAGSLAEDASRVRETRRQFFGGEKIRIVKHYYMDAKGNEVWNFFVVVDVVLAGSSI